jgi:hypothetical protein
MRNKCIILAGAIAQKPSHGGHTWVFLQYLLGFKRMGFDVLLIDRLDEKQMVNSGGQPCPPSESIGYLFLKNCLASFGLDDCFSILIGKDQTLGLNRADLLERIKQSTLLLDVMGFLRDPELLNAAPLSAFLDIDPGFAQMWKETGLADSLSGHDAYITVGRNVGKEDCLVPCCGFNWITIAPPVVLEQWLPHAQPTGPITSVATWRGTYGTVTYQGKTFGLRVPEFRKFFDLPRRASKIIPPFELALDIHPDETKDLNALHQGGWILKDPKTVAGDTRSYRSHIQNSSAEFCVAKNMYVQARTGWFSDRSAVYLATGKPVLAQETGWSQYYPHDAGLLPFSTLAEAGAAVDAVFSDYSRHSRAAVDIARDYFDSDRVLSGLLKDLGIA